jgi:hypothetical protein
MMGSLPARILFSAALLGVVSGMEPVWCQSPAGVKLRPPTARLDEEFTRIVGVRELSDGRVLVAERFEPRLVVADFSRNLVVQIGRSGKGPGEYSRIDALSALGTDSTLLDDGANGRWLVLLNDQVVHTLPPDHPAIKSARGLLRGTDARGQILTTTSPPIREGKPTLGKGDSIAAVIVRLSTGASDTVGRLRTAPLTVWTERDQAGKVKRAGLTYPPFSVGEEPVLFSDGWLAVARLDPYRVDWRAPDGRWQRGAPLPFTAREVDRRERQAYLARRAAMLGRAETPPADDSWPDAIPPFQPTPLVAAPDGSLLILRTPTADAPGHRYDRVNRRGQLLGWLELPPTEQLAAIGVHGAYVIATDGDGIQRLQRHPWPVRE